MSSSPWWILGTGPVDDSVNVSSQDQDQAYAGKDRIEDLLVLFPPPPQKQKGGGGGRG